MNKSYVIRDSYGNVLFAGSKEGVTDWLFENVNITGMWIAIEEESHEERKRRIHREIEAEVAEVRENMNFRGVESNEMYVVLREKGFDCTEMHPEVRSRRDMINYLAALEWEAGQIQDEVADGQYVD